MELRPTRLAERADVGESDGWGQGELRSFLVRYELSFQVKRTSLGVIDAPGKAYGDPFLPELA